MATSSSSGGGVPPGFRFHPTDEELLHYYLKKKISFQKFDMEVIREVDLNKIEPWDLQEKCRIGSTPQNDWYFFSHKDKKYPTGSRTNRATSAGFWKATGRDKCIRNSFKKIGMRKTLVFYRGRAPHGQKTDWIMHEYRLEDPDDHDAQQGNLCMVSCGESVTNNMVLHDFNHEKTRLNIEDGWVVCRVFKKKNFFKATNVGGANHNNNIINLDHHNHQLMINNNNTNPSNTMMINSNILHMNNNNRESTINNYQYQQQHNNNLGSTQLHTFDLYNKTSSSDHHRQLSLHYPNLPLPPLNNYACDLGLDALGTCEQQVGQQNNMVGSDQWAIMGHHEEQSSSKGLRFHEVDANASSTSQTNNNNPSHHHELSLRSEMDFWGYEK